MKKCCFIVPYFGKLPKHFPIFLKTCEYNLNYDWLFFTDDNAEYILPSNVKIIKISFLELKNIFQNKFDFEICLNNPYKLCDYKPAYGYIFEDFIPYDKYKFWGHCDIDTIMGNLDTFLTNDLLDEYDKIFALGHMILYKNSYENNRIFMKKYDEEFLYKKAFQTDKIMVFDEFYFDNYNIDSIFLNENKNVFFEDFSLNIKIFPTKFIRVQLDYDKRQFVSEEFRDAIYIWDKGHLYRFFIEHDKIKKQEFLYAHFQSRDMKIHRKLKEYNYFKILPNIFQNVEYESITEENFKKIKRKRICFHYLKKHLESKIRKLTNWRKKVE